MHCFVYNRKHYFHTHDCHYFVTMPVKMTILIATGNYMYIETSAPRHQGQKAQLYSPATAVSSPQCVSFFYHMYGNNIGSLNVYVTLDGSLSNPVWSQSGNQQNKWTQAQFTLNPNNQRQQVTTTYTASPIEVV